jgi:hypothetical protein
MVFGDAFVYSNCLQRAYASLRSLATGSIILFGRHSRVAHRPAFSLDTCLVVDRVEELEPVPFDPARYGENILDDAVLGPLCSEEAADAFAVYFGKTRTEDERSSFSFFPARLLDDPNRVFARPQLVPTGSLNRVISSENMQGIKSATVSPARRDAIWQEVVCQVVEQDCALGYRATTPPLLDDGAANSAALRAPAPLD